MNSSRKMANTIAITLMLIFASVTVVATVPANAQLAAQQPIAGPLPSGATPSITIESIPYLSFSPNPIGLGQPLLVNVWMQPPINIARNLENAFQVTVTKPDGTKEVIGPLSSYQGDATAWFTYVPDQVGNYTLKLDFLGMYYPAGRYVAGVIVANTSGTNLNSAYYKPSATKEQVLIVQQDMVPAWPAAPLPTDYWTRPVSVDNREWWKLLGNYPATGYGPAIYTNGETGYWDKLYPNTNPYWSSPYSFLPYVQAPNSSHLVWKRQGGIGGLIGGVFGTINLRDNPGYPDIICAGMCYQTVTKVFDGVTQSVWQCYDLRTGEIYWEKTGITQTPTTITYTQRTSTAVIGEEANMRGLAVELLYIGGGRMIKYDPWNGAVTTNVSISPLTTGTYYLHEYALSVQDLGAAAGANRYRLINWTTNGALANLTTSTGTRVISNISWPISSLPSTIDFNIGVAVYQTSENPPGTVSGTGVSIGQRLAGINIRTGQVMWNVTTTAPDGHEQFFSTNDAVADNGVIINRMITGEIKAWDLYTGNVKWSTPLSYPWGCFGGYHVASAYGLYFCDSYDGYHAINETTGKIEWTFHAYTPYQFETGYQTSIGSAEYVFHGGMQVADGKVYVYAMEHTQSQPTTRGLKLYCLNVFTGQQLWNFSGSEVAGGRSFAGAIADGYLAFANGVDSVMYVFGKGKSTTTVTAPQTTVTKGTSVLIQGTVLDQSPAQLGTPCVSAESMNAYMYYLHNQGPNPASVIGVPVTLTAIGSDNTVIDVGIVTTNGFYGTFSKAWSPPDEGTYTIVASFAGDASYGTSSAATGLSVGPAAEEINIPEQMQPIDYTMTLIIGFVAVIVAVAIVGILVVKKK